MVELRTLVNFCDQRLSAQALDDYCPNGLQVEAGQQVRRLVTGVTASLALIEAAAEAGADALLVHHGYFWKGEPAPIVGLKARRIRLLMEKHISLIAYHLPLDVHPELGNNRQLAERLGFFHAVPLDDEGGLIWGAELPETMTASALASRITSALDRLPLHIDAGPDLIGRVAWCTGAAQGYVEKAAAAGFDAYITGEISEPSVHLARELGIHFFSAGHHATERFGVQSLGAELASRFGLEHQFIDIPNPV